MDEGDSGPGPEPKVVRMIRKYGLEDLGADLEARWTHSESRESLRDLADRVNERILRAALREASVETLTEDVARLYAVIDNDEASPGERNRIVRRLERGGVDADELLADFVSYQAVRTYLTNYRDASLPERGDADEIRETEAQNIEQLRQRAAAVAESKVERLVATDRLQIGSHHVLTDVQIFCETCGKQYDASELIRAGACDCYDRAERS